MTDKDVQRNVRSSGEEGVQTPTQKHYRSLSEKDNIPFGEGGQKKAQKKSILAKFRKREERLRKKEKEKKSSKSQKSSKATK